LNRIEELIMDGCDCSNCVYSHYFGEKLKCSLNAKFDDGSDYKEVDEESIIECWSDKRS
jgi:hypothetical protein